MSTTLAVEVGPQDKGHKSFHAHTKVSVIRKPADGAGRLCSLIPLAEHVGNST